VIGEDLDVDRPTLPARRHSPVALQRTAWKAALELDLHDWADQGRRLGGVSRAVGWWVGDWLRYGNERFGERYVQGARITGYDVQTLMNMVYVASRFEPARRRDQLSFSHHAELAPLEPDAQEHWLARAETEGLSVRCLRQELRRQRSLERPAEPLAHEPAPRASGRPDMVCPQCGCAIEPTPAPAAA
jgi:hypothetical protein